MSPMLLNPYEFANVPALKAAFLAPGPAGLWMSDEASGSTLVDSSGNGKDLTITGSPTSYQQTLGGTLVGVKWPNNTGVVAVGGSAMASTQDFCICAFCYMSADIVANANVFAITGSSGSTTNFEFGLTIIRTTGSTFQARLRMNNGALRTMNGTSGGLALNTRYFIAAMASAAGGMRIRINKTEQTPVAQNAASGHGAQVPRIHDGELITNGTYTGGPVAYYRSVPSDAQLDAIADAA